MLQMKIGEVNRRTGLTDKTIRFYERRGLISVPRGENRYRDYDAETVARLVRIKRMRELGIPVADIRLWCDGIVSTQELIRRRQRELENENAFNQRQQALCLALLNGTPFELPEGDFTEPELELDPALPADRPAVLGVDIGTSSISAQLIAVQDGTCLHTYTFDHGCALSGAEDACAEDAERLLDRAVRLVDSVMDAFPGVCAVGFTGQMHGIVCLDAGGRVLSPLYTWQNRFGLRSLGGETVTGRIRRLTGETVPTGYGLATLYALRELGLLPHGTAHIATIMDAAVLRLCGSDRVCTHPTDAASLGFYDAAARRFRQASLDRLGIEPAFLPDVTPDWTCAGRHRGVPVAAAIGDNQASVFGALRDDGSVLVNIGTSSQVSVLAPLSASPGAGESRPYPDGRQLISGAALCGGRAYAALADFFCESAALFGQPVSRHAAYACMDRLAEQPPQNLPEVDTRFCGTRADPAAHGAIRGLELSNFTPAHLVCGVLYGMVRELRELYDSIRPGTPPQKIVVSGNAVRRNPALCRIIGELFGAPVLVTCHTEEAAFGAALYAAVACGITDYGQARSFIRYQTDRTA